MAKKIFKTLKRMYMFLFKQKCPNCNGVMYWEMIDMEFDKNVYKCLNCGKRWI